MKIGFYSWREMIYRTANPRGIVISIRNPGTENPEFEPGWKAIHTEFFHDIDGRYDGFRAMSQWQAMRIAAFVERQLRQGIDEVAIHCHDGVSRSAGIATATARHLGLSLTQPNDGANRLVEARMRWAYGALRLRYPLKWRTAASL
jgi:predicted protein tyrosine phosphatase